MTHPGPLPALVPKPITVEFTGAEFVLRDDTVIVIGDGADAADAADLLRASIGAPAGATLPVVAPADGEGTDGRRTITFASDPTADSEGYTLRVRSDTVTITAGGHDGFLWAVQTLRQLVAVPAAGPPRSPGRHPLPGVTVVDAPRYRWRGTMLDVARHFFPVADVKAFIDQAATYKLNRLHLHLTDDQGWRLEIRSHRALADVGGRTQVGGGPGGHYTQADYRDLVDYARRRGVTVVPEIDVPGHTNAALVADPTLAEVGVTPEPYTGTEVGFSSLRVDADHIERWLDDVIGELAALTPGPWIHLGGDESHATPTDAYRRFVTRALAIVRAHGKTPIGWEEIGRADLDGPTIVQHWLDPAPAGAAADQGASIIASPATATYLDLAYDTEGPGHQWAGVVPTRAAYEWDPVDRLPGVAPDRIIGVEAPLWTEFVPDRATIQRRTLPRLPAVAEVGWTAPGDRDWDDFRTRLAGHAAHWDGRGWAWTRDAGIDWPG